MDPLHVRLLAGTAGDAAVAALRTALESAGHLVTGGPNDPVPRPYPAIPDFVITGTAEQPVPESLEAAEARHVALVLRHVGGNRRQAALLLGIARSTLLAKIRKYGL